MTEDEEFEFRRRRESEQAAQVASPVKGLPDFQTGAGGAAFGNPRIKANNPKPESDAPYEAGGAVTDTLASAGLPPSVAAAGGYATNLGMKALPVLLGGGGGKAAAPAVEDTARYLMQSAIKPTIADLKSGKAARALQTMFDEGVNATKGGVEKMRATADDLHAQVADLIKNSPATVKTDIANALDFVVKKFANRPNAVEAADDAANAAKQFAEHPMVGNASDIPVQTAHELKRGYQASVGDKAYGEAKTAVTESEKAIARAMRERVGQAVPEVLPLNARESALINAMKVAERRALLDGNKNPLGLAALTHSPESFLAHLASGNALAKSSLARLLYAGRNNIPVAAGAAAGGAYSSLSDLER